MTELRHALRSLRRSPAFLTLTLFTVAIGIGASTLIYAVASAVVFRPLPFQDEAHLYWVWSTRPDRDRAFFSIPDFLDLKRENRTTADMAAITPIGITLTGVGEAERVPGWRVTANLFSVLGSKAHIGRLPQVEDEAPGAAPVAVLAYGYWQRRFGGDPIVIGRVLTLNGGPRTIVGVLPADFVIPNADTDIVLTQSLESDPRRGERGTNFFRAIARLKPGVTATEAQAEFATLNARLMQRYPDTNAIVTAPRFVSLRDEVVGGYRASLLLLLGAVGALLLIMCANLAGLLAARGLGRQREAALCSALGASPARLLRFFLAEGLLIALAGGLLGILACVWGLHPLLALAPADLPRASLVSIDARVVLVALGATLLTGVGVGLAPALRLARTTPLDALKSGAGTTTNRTAARAVLVAVQISLSTALLVCTGLLVRSLREMLQSSPGFVSAHALVSQVSLPAADYRTVPAVTRFIDEYARRLGALPGVQAVSLTSILPLSGINTRSEFIRADRPPARPTDTLSAANRYVMENFFVTAGIPLLAGRDFRPADDAHNRPVVIIDHALARRCWPGEDPVGKSILLRDGTSPEPRELVIVGVVGTTKHFSLEEAGTPAIYLPVRQMLPGNLGFFLGRLNFIVRTVGDPLALKESARQALRATEGSASVTVRSFDEAVAWAQAPRVFNVRLLSFFAGMAVLLSLLGLYAVTAQSVAARTREIGIRMALGADRLRIAREVFGSGARVVFSGITGGLALAMACSPLFGRMLFQVPSVDTMTYGLVAAGLAATALLATWVPVRRATRIDPLVALRTD